MSKKKGTSKIFNVGFVMSIWLDKEIKAATPEAAFQIARDMSYEKIMKDIATYGVNDSHWDVMQVCEQDVLEKHGF